MLSEELSKLKVRLEGKTVEIDMERLLVELKELEKKDKFPLLESLSPSDGVCPTCGRKL
ncbi:hypothetical protein [Acetobacterium wieringae]|uniref:hypothetical protein n=1 Tax=Acetobacterium wieringae TaxID=52694 RepID=UPI0031581236